MERLAGRGHCPPARGGRQLGFARCSTSNDSTRGPPYALSTVNWGIIRTQAANLSCRVPVYVRAYPLGVKRRQFAQAKRRWGYILAACIVVAIALPIAMAFAIWQLL